MTVMERGKEKRKAGHINPAGFAVVIVIQLETFPELS